MKCRFCGTNLPDDARFCSGCGREIEREDVSAKEKNNNETEDAYYREIDDKEYEEIKKKKKEEERQREEAAKEEADANFLRRNMPEKRRNVSGVRNSVSWKNRAGGMKRNSADGKNL